MLKPLLEISLLALGVLTIIASVRNWAVLFDDGHQPKNLGRIGARIVYGALGAIIATAGLVSALRPLV